MLHDEVKQIVEVFFTVFQTFFQPEFIYRNKQKKLHPVSNIIFKSKTILRKNFGTAFIKFEYY